MEKELIIDKEELQIWEQEQYQIVLNKFDEKNTKMKDTQLKSQKRKSRQEKQMKYFFRKEEKHYRRMNQKIFRAKWKMERSKGRYHIPRNREYKTYGYLTW